MYCSPHTNRARIVVAAFLALGFVFSSAHSQGRTDSSAVQLPDAEANTESLLDQIETESDNSELVDRMNWLQEHPFNLNTVSREELSTIPRLTPAEVTAILDFRKQIRKFVSAEQVAQIENSGEEIFRKIHPYVIIESDESSRGFVRITSRASRDLQRRSGFLDSSFAGSSVKSYSRLTIAQSEKLQGGLLIEKDAGERLGDGFVSGYAVVKDWSFISQAIVGDYVVEAGQGLVLWRSTAFGKGSEAVSIVKKSGLAVQPYRSADEFNYLRGAAVTSTVDLGEGKLLLTALYSRRLLSASGDAESISSFYEEGLFRTQTELLKKSNVVEKILGGRAQFNSAADWNVGGTFYNSSFSKPIVADGVFEFTGTSATVAGVDAEVNLGWMAPKLSQITLFGEAARSGNGAGAGIVGSVIRFTQNTSLALIYRNYTPRFTSLHATGFGERSNTKNERGFYVGADIRPVKWLHLSSYLDHFKFPWRTFDNPFPTSGRDILLQADANVPHGIDLSLRYTNKTTETTEAAIDAFARDARALVDRSQQKFRLTATYQVNKRVRLRGRMETTAVRYTSLRQSEGGFLFYQELQYALPPNFTAEARLVFFDTDSYDSRLYEYENDLRGVFSNPALYGKGRRWYILVRWKVADVLRLSAKYSETQFEGVKSIGSGLTEIQGDLDNRIAMQVEVRL